VVLHPGDTVDVRFTKWDGGRHWEFPVTVLGSDDHGVWAGAVSGTRLWRPAAAFVSAFDWVTLFPHESAWAASFYDSDDQPVALYVDMATPAVWSDRTVSIVDLDLDVVLLRDGTLFLDDEGEFEAHQVELGYPPEVVAMALAAADEVLAAVAGRAEPFGTVGAAWVDHWRQCQPSAH
jgi:protein associated with RNAse G/E